MQSDCTIGQQMRSTPTTMAFDAPPFDQPDVSALSQAWPKSKRRSKRKKAVAGASITCPVLAVDAAQGVGCALVYPRQNLSQRPRLVSTWVWNCASFERWAEQMDQCIIEALAMCTAHNQPAPLFVVERAEGAVRYKSRGVDMFQGLGRRQGIALAEWRHHRPPRSRVGLLVRQSWWTQVLDLQSGKRDGGTHREAEARFYLTGAAEGLASVDVKLRVDAAEAALIGAAVSLYGSKL